MRRGSLELRGLTGVARQPFTRMTFWPVAESMRVIWLEPTGVARQPLTRMNFSPVAESMRVIWLEPPGPKVPTVPPPWPLISQEEEKTPLPVPPSALFTHAAGLSCRAHEHLQCLSEMRVSEALVKC